MVNNTAMVLYGDKICHSDRFITYLIVKLLCWSVEIWGFSTTQMVKNLLAMQETWVSSPGQEDPLEKERLPSPVFLPGESHGQRNNFLPVYFP